MLKLVVKTMAGVSLVTLVVEALIIDAALAKAICIALPSVISEAEKKRMETE